jgi:hypothetical protein
MTEPLTQAESADALQRLYPIFKEEVYKRRAAMAQIARRGALVFVSLSVIATLLSGGRFIHPGLKGLASAGVGLAALLLIFQIRQEKSRHEKAKLQLITLERGLRLFEPGAYLPNEPLYPSEWQDRPAIDRGLWISIASLIGTALILIAAILLA